MAVFSEAEGNSLLAGLEKAGASLRPEGFEGEVRLRAEQDSGGNNGTRREKVEYQNITYITSWVYILV